MVARIKAEYMCVRCTVLLNGLFCCRELESVAAELGRMSAGSNGRTQVPTANHLRSQFDGLLEQQAAAEALEVEVRKHQHTQALLVEKQQKLQMASAEVIIRTVQMPVSPLRHIVCNCNIVHSYFISMAEVIPGLLQLLVKLSTQISYSRLSMAV